MVQKSKKKVNYEKSWSALAIARLMIGFVFFWAFIDKAFGLGLATPAAKAWLAGGSPTTGFLTGVSKGAGPFADFFGAMIGNPFVDWLFMLGLLGIGVALMLGVGLRVAAVTGTILLVMMWAAELPLTNNPIVDDHLVYAVVLWVVALAPRRWSIANWWLSQPSVKKNPWLW